MSDRSAIEWTDTTWNPVTGCDKVSPGCGLPRWDGDDSGGCYAMALAKRLKAMGQVKYQRDGDPRTSGPGFGVTVHPAALPIPLRWRSPRMVFVNSMSDLFHAHVPCEFIAAVCAVMAATPQHTYQILTKRPRRAARILGDRCTCGAGHADGVHLRSQMDWAATPHSPTYVPGLPSGLYHRMIWPLPNVWLGTSIEDQRRANERIPVLLDTPAAVRWLSCEPLLGPVDLTHLRIGPGRYLDALRGPTRIDWVVVGGESGPGARPMNPDWARALRDQCTAAGVAFFLKQWGGRTPKAGGRDLDGQTWDQYPHTGAPAGAA